MPYLGRFMLYLNRFLLYLSISSLVFTVRGWGTAPV